MLPVLPIEKVLPNLRAAFATHRNVLLSANPGAGKTTRVPIALMNEQWLHGQKIIMLEPRRLAAIRAAEYMASQLNESAGGTIGYRIRGDNKVSDRTTIEVVTEGVLTRMIQNDPILSTVGLLIFDEFHERSIHADLALALALDVQRQVRSDLRILVMSATLTHQALSTMLGNAPVVKSEGRLFPVDTIYLQQHHSGMIEPLVASTIVKALRETEGDVLVFLPGQKEIRRTESLLLEKHLPDSIQLHVLYGEAPLTQQRAALLPAGYGKRKVILSTSVAETSLTIDGVRVVIDSGLSRSSSFDPRRGMSGLVTLPVSQSSAEQRRGRAGRQQPGICYRLWTQAEHALLPQFNRPEILVADLTSFVLEVALWGDSELQQLKFLDIPPPAHFQQAITLLKNLGAMDEHGKLTEHGNSIARLGIHPRLAHMIIKGKELNLGSLACDVAAMLEDNDVLRGSADVDVDLYSRYVTVANRNSNDHHTIERIREQSLRLHSLIDESPQYSFTLTKQINHLGKLLALAYPERVARRKPKSEKYQLSGNTIGRLPKNSMLGKEEYLAVAEVDGAGDEVKIFLAEPVSKEDIFEVVSEQLITTKEIFWDEKTESVVARSVAKFGALELSQHWLEPTSEEAKSIVCAAIRSMGLHRLPWDKESVSLRLRSEWLRKNRLVPINWITLSDEHLLVTLEQWLGPYLEGITQRKQFSTLSLGIIIRSLFTYEQLKQIDILAPTHLTVPSGSRIVLDYSTAQPVLAVRLQEMFGETKTPTVAGGQVKVLLHLLSPAHRPLAVTQDLPSFWKNVYPDVRKEMRRQYPKHYWPENPLEAQPTRKTTKQLRSA